LYRQTLLTHTIYYLIDSETLYILDEVVTFGERNPDAMLQMLMGFSGKNHVVSSDSPRTKSTAQAK
jgi:hypothetical protein